MTYRAYGRYQEGLAGGFKLGVDLSGGTILVYEVDRDPGAEDKIVDPNAPNDGDGDGDIPIDKLAESLKRRIDPADLKNVTIRPVGRRRIEIILPTGGGKSSTGRDNLTAEEVQQVKDLIAQVGSLEFRILANDLDDAAAWRAATEWFESAKTTPTLADQLRRRALDGQPPPAPSGDFKALGETASYAWVELGPQERHSLSLDNDVETNEKRRKTLWDSVKTARDAGVPYQQKSTDEDGTRTSMLIWSRPCVSKQISDAEREKKKYDYFLLTRSSDSVKVGGNVTITASSTTDERLRPAISFRFNSVGANQFYALTNKNIPAGDPTQGGKLARQLSIILDNLMISAPRINSAIGASGQITGEFTKDEVDRMVKLLRSGALPATLKPLPVSENTIGPTLGQDTITNGTWAIIWAFASVLIFMVIYYRFAGLVACVALFANLLLTVGFMIAVNATFTLPGLAGLVLTLGMAVDANVLIYERVREERDRGANLITAIRNGYDRAFPTIIDTHLSSIFTACVLYAVGNDQLKGFGVSLASGLIISLFTSLFMTRLIFDFWLAKKWLTQLRMLRFFSKPKIDFMSLWRIFMPTTVILTLLGLGLFLWRGENSLNVDFRGGTAYGGQFAEGQTITDLRDLIAKSRQDELLQVEKVTPIVDPTGKLKNAYEIVYKDGTTARIALANKPDGATEEEQIANVVDRAKALPDASVDQLYLKDDPSVAEGKSKYFTIRTTEREPELVQVAINRLFTKKDGDKNVSLLARTELKSRRIGNAWELDFGDRATSPSFIKMLLDREFAAALPKDVKVNRQLFDLRGEGDAAEGRFKKMMLEPGLVAFDAKKTAQNVATAFGVPMDLAVLVTPAYLVDFQSPTGQLFVDPTKTANILKDVKTAFEERPQPERLETFDPTLASETRSRALYAILASWGAIMLYLWFRFGNWTFGLAAVLCLIHDLCFTLGIIAGCHYLYDTFFGTSLMLQDFKIDLPAIAALLTLVGYSVNDTIVVFDRIREVRGKSPVLTSDMINQSVNQTLSRTLLASLTTFLVVIVLYIYGGEGVHLFAFVMVVGVIIGTYSSIYVASPLLLIFGEGTPVVPNTTAAAKKAAQLVPDTK